MKKNTKAGKIALSLAIAAAVTVSTGTLFKANAAQISGFTLPDITTTAYGDNGAYNINVAPGSDATSLGFTWFSQSQGEAKLRIALKGADLSAVTPITAEQLTVTATVGANKGDTGEYSNKATATGLTPNTEYDYQVSNDGTNWTTTQTVKTLKSDGVSFAAFGDPQIGAFDDNSAHTKSKSAIGHANVGDDESGWGKMLNYVTGQGKFDFLFTMGDQVNDYNTLDNGSQDGQWWQYNYFFRPNGSNIFRNIPLVAFAGNHDNAMSDYYGFHYNQSHLDTLGATTAGNDGDYWFRSGPVLFLVLNANNPATASHDEFLTKAISQNQDAKWKVAAWHQSAYSEASHASPTAGDDNAVIMQIRNTWPKMMDTHNIDVVLQGHDHFYTRTAQIYDGTPILADGTKTPVDSTDWLDKADVTTTATNNGNAVTSGKKDYTTDATNPQGTVYFTLDSGSGSKYYDWQSDADHSFSVKSWQGYIPTFSNVSFTDDKFTIDTYAVNTSTLSNTPIDHYSITKTADTNPGGGDNNNNPQTVDVGEGNNDTETVDAATIAGLKDGDTVSVNLKNAALALPQSVIDHLLTTNPGVTSITVDESTVDASTLSLGTGYDPKAAIQFDLKDQNGNSLKNQEFGGQNITITWTIAKDKADTINDKHQFFRVNDDNSTDKLDATFSQKTESGAQPVVFSTAHFSQFAVANVTTATPSSNPSSTSSDTSASNPHTGSVQDALVNAASIVAVVLMLGGAAFVVLRKKKRV